METCGSPRISGPARDRHFELSQIKPCRHEPERLSVDGCWFDSLAFSVLRYLRRHGMLRALPKVCYVVVMPLVPSTEQSGRNRRRSKRIQHKTPVTVRFRDVNKQSVTEKTHTIIVSDHGALILLAATVEAQQVIRLENPSAEEELLCRVVSLGPTLMGKTQVAVEFIIPKPGFWGAPSSPKTSEFKRTLKK